MLKASPVQFKCRRCRSRPMWSVCGSGTNKASKADGPSSEIAFTSERFRHNWTVPGALQCTILGYLLTHEENANDACPTCVEASGTPRTHKSGEALGPGRMLELSALAAADSTDFYAEKWARVFNDRQECYGRKTCISFVVVVRCPLSALGAGLAAYAFG